jgi:hypothetical protein
LAGRVLGRLRFQETRRTEYLTVADDAAKAALFALAEGGHRVVAFAEDTIVTEADCPADLGEKAKEAGELARRGAEEVLGTIPLTCAGKGRNRW